jgi:hypothetical protein
VRAGTATTVDEVSEVVQDGVGDALEDVGGVPGDERGAGRAQRGGGRADMADRLGDHVRAPVRRDQHDVGGELFDGVEQPGR